MSNSKKIFALLFFLILLVFICVYIVLRDNNNEKYGNNITSNKLSSENNDLKQKNKNTTYNNKIQTCDNAGLDRNLYENENYKNNSNLYIQDENNFNLINYIDKICYVVKVVKKIHISGTAFDINGEPVFPGHIISVGGGFFDKNGRYDSYTIDINTVKAVYYKNGKICRISTIEKNSNNIYFKCKEEDFEILSEEDMDEIEIISTYQYSCHALYKDKLSIDNCLIMSRYYEDILNNL